MASPNAEGIGPSEFRRTPPRVRASDADREAVVAVLHDAVVRGLLNLEEGSERVTAAYGARFLDDLSPLTADLPPAPATAPTAPGWRALALLAWLQLRTLFTRTTMRQVRSRPRFALAVAALLAVLALGAMVGDFGGHGFGAAPRFEHAHPFGPVGPPAPPAPPAGR